MTKSKDNDPRKPATLVAHAGGNPKERFGFVNPPVYHGSTILFETADSLFKLDQRYIYGCGSSPNIDALADAMAELDGADGAFVVPSGLNAIATVLLALCQAGDHILVSDSVYRPTRRFCDGLLKKFGVETSYYDPVIGPEIAGLLKSNTRLVFTEAPGSQTMEMQDIPAITSQAHDKSVLVVMDNTWATPVFFKPFDHGVDVSIIAATKFIGGHSDVMLGTISANGKCLSALREAYTRLGVHTGPDDAALALRGLRTLPLRLERHMASGLTVAKWLKQRREVATMFYPALEDDLGHDIWARDFSGAPGVFSMVLDTSNDKAIRAFLDGLSLFRMGYSWGGFESLIVPFDPRSYRSATPWRHEGQAVRLHVGLEDANDLIADLEAGFAAMAKCG